MFQFRVAPIFMKTITCRVSSLNECFFCYCIMVDPYHHIWSRKIYLNLFWLVTGPKIEQKQVLILFETYQVARKCCSNFLINNIRYNVREKIQDHGSNEGLQLKNLFLRCKSIYLCCSLCLWLSYEWFLSFLMFHGQIRSFLARAAVSQRKVASYLPLTAVQKPFGNGSKIIDKKLYLLS